MERTARYGPLLEASPPPGKRASRHPSLSAKQRPRESGACSFLDARRTCSPERPGRNEQPVMDRCLKPSPSGKARLAPSLSLRQVESRPAVRWTSSSFETERFPYPPLTSPQFGRSNRSRTKASLRPWPRRNMSLVTAASTVMSCAETMPMSTKARLVW